MSGEVFVDTNVLYSEDLQDGQIILQRLTIRNPFAPPIATAQVT